MGRKRPGKTAPDIEIGASLQARELRFEAVPDMKTRFEGDPGYEAEVQTEREGLPDRIDPGVTYRRVRVRGRASMRIADP